MTLEDAILLATEAHAGQVDKRGAPYILHPLRVMLAVEDRDRVVAVLHDVFEDCPLYEMPPGVSAEEEEALEALTRGPGEDYSAFIGRIQTSPMATRVKIADLRDNLGRDPPGRLRERYQAALARLAP